MLCDNIDYKMTFFNAKRKMKELNFYLLRVFSCQAENFQVFLGATKFLLSRRDSNFGMEEVYSFIYSLDFDISLGDIFGFFDI